MGANEGITWSLVFRGQERTEGQGGLLREMPRGAILLSAMRGRKPLATVMLPEKRPPGHGPWQPVFYRRNEMAEGVSRVALVVFGRACEGPDGAVVSECWTIEDGETAGPCPERHIDHEAIGRFVREPLRS